MPYFTHEGFLSFFLCVCVCVCLIIKQKVGWVTMGKRNMGRDVPAFASHLH